MARKKKQTIKPIEGAIRTVSHDGMRLSSIVSRENMIREGQEADRYIWATTSLFCVMANITQNYGNSVCKKLSLFGRCGNDQMMSIKRWVSALGRNIDTLFSVMRPCFKHGNLQTVTVGALQMVFEELLEIITGVTDDGEFSDKDKSELEVCIIPKSLRAAIESSPALKEQVRWVSDEIAQLIEDNNRFMAEHGIDPSSRNVDIRIKKQ